MSLYSLHPHPPVAQTSYLQSPGIVLLGVLEGNSEQMIPLCISNVSIHPSIPYGAET